VSPAEWMPVSSTGMTGKSVVMNEAMAELPAVQSCLKH
jgi:hypothetical protein